MDNWHLHADSLVIWQNGAFSNHGNKIKKKKSQSPVQRKEANVAQRPLPVSETQELWCKPDMSCLRSSGAKRNFRQTCDRGEL